MPILVKSKGTEEVILEVRGYMELDDCQLALLFERMKASQYDGIELKYPFVSDEWIKPHFRGIHMDLQREVLKREGAVADEQDAKEFFVAPVTEQLPDDGVLEYATIESIYDISSVADRSVVQFSHSQIPLLKLICENTAILGLRPTVLSGLPGAEYTAAFDSATWSAERVAYSPLISELTLAAEVRDQLSASQLTTHDKEKMNYTRKNGTVKAQTDFDIAGEDDA